MRLTQVTFFGNILVMGKLSFTVTQEEMAGPDGEVNSTLQARSRYDKLWFLSHSGRAVQKALGK